MPARENLKKTISALEYAIKLLKELDEEENRVDTPPTSEIDQLREFTDLRLLARGRLWPVAIPEELVSDENNVADMIDRANGVLDRIGDVNGKVFLDYGGDPHVVAEAAKRGADANGPYEWHPLSAHAEKKYDIILLNDVLDHVGDPIKILKQIKELKKDGGIVHARCHPWTSRHGTHLFRTLNRAYLQLVFTPAELVKMGLLQSEIPQKPLDPIQEYKKWFAEAGLEVKEESTIKQPVDAFFINKPAVLRRIKETMNCTEFPHKILEVQFADFVLV